MYALLLLGTLACAGAAPHYDHDYHHHHHHGYGAPPPFSPRDDFASGEFGMGEHFGHGGLFFRDNVFDTRRFWSELSREMAMFDEMLTDFAKRFPSSVSSEGIDLKTNEYKVTISLTGFEEKDIIVKAREGVLMVQAVQKKDGADQRSYLDVRSLPDYVNVTGSWTYEKGVLKVVFPLLSKATEEPEITTELVTESPKQFQPESREDVDKGNSDDQDADVGAGRGDADKENELNTNEIPNKELIEATTYAVDLKDEVEFVPVRY